MWSTTWLIFRLFLLIHNIEITHCSGLSRSLYLQKVSHQKILVADSSDLLAIDGNVEAVECVEKCMLLLECSSFNYDFISIVCEYIPESQPVSLTSVQNWDLYRVVKAVTQNGNVLILLSIHSEMDSLTKVLLDIAKLSFFIAMT